MTQSNKTDRLFYALDVNEVYEALDSSHEGLSQDEASQRLETHGANVLPERKDKHPILKFLEHFNNVLIYVLLIAAVGTALLDHWIDTWIILAVVLINGTIGYVQERKAEKALEAVKGMLALSAHVHRQGDQRDIDAKDLVPGDIVALKSGDRVPADLRIVEVKGLTVNEASLTGESKEISKKPEPVSEDAALGDRFSMAYSGTIVTSGQGLGIVAATGERTEIGKINAMLSEVKKLTTPLLRQIDQFGRQLSVIILVIAALTFVVGYYWVGMELSEAFLAVVGIAVAAIPEGLPAIMSITLAIGVERMAGRNAIIRRLPAVETLGSVSVICSDKTGTLTRGEMAATRLQLRDEEIEVTGTGYAPKGDFKRNNETFEPEGILLRLIEATAACNDSRLREDEEGWVIDGAPTEGALLTMAAKAGITRKNTDEKWRRLDSIPFASEHKFMATLHEGESGRLIFLKGAPEQVFQRCAHEIRDGDEAPIDLEGWREKADRLAGSGHRLLAVASRSAADQAEIDFPDVEEGFTLLGLIGLQDPPREETIMAVEECKEAGIRVKMITGDHALTARSIGDQIGIGDGETAMTGAEIETTSDEDLIEAADKIDVFARVSPEHKLRLLTALQAKGRIAAMTGDGVNDAPALKKADIGIAMGIKGTEAAKESSEMVLADDNFASIVHAVEEGRIVYDNIKKSLLFILPTNGGESLLIIVAIALGLVLPITPAQILWVNMVTAVTLALALAFEPMEKNVMKRAPRDPNESLVTPTLLLRIVIVSIFLMAASFGVFAYYKGQGVSIEFARTMAVNMLIIGEIFYLFNSRLISNSALSREGLMATRYVWSAVIAVILFQMAFTYLPVFHQLFGTAPIGVTEWGIMAILGAVIFLLVEVEKAITLKFIMKENR